MANINKLKCIMKEKNITQQMLSDKLNIELAMLERKLNTEESSFTVGEADVIVKMLHLDAETASEIFFTTIVS